MEIERWRTEKTVNKDALRMKGEVNHFPGLLEDKKEGGLQIPERVVFESVFGSTESDSFFKNLGNMLNQIGFPEQGFVEEVRGDTDKIKSVRGLVEDYMYAVDLEGKKSRCDKLEEILG